ncbi:transmembrane signal receptor [Lithospermum erythrorhizon]|uniref:Transmembrane signal receptor n=1 Tax=Lithospermum erythrorhizon TaxID=34254 RepID=A0AAV3RSN0_LITER
MRVFGCLCFATFCTHNTDKVTPKACKAILIGYSSAQKDYKLYDLMSHEVFISRDVVFHETVFPFSQSVMSSANTPVPVIDSISFDPPIHESSLPVMNNMPVSQDIVDVDPESHSESLSAPLTSSEHNITKTPGVRHSTRNRKQPPWLSDFVSNATSLSEMPHTFPFVSSVLLTASHVEFLANVSLEQKSYSYAQAKESSQWIQAMQKEVQALHENCTWEVVDLPKDKKAIGCKWVVKIKTWPDGTIESCSLKAMAYSPVGCHNAFLHEQLEEDIYMKLPPGYPDQGKNKAYGFVQSSHDDYLFVLQTEKVFLALLVYVDDILITGNSLSDINKVKAYLHDVFIVKDMGQAKFFLGIEVFHTSPGVFLNQRKYLLDILANADMLSCKPVATPMVTGLLSTDDTSPLL